MKKLFCALYVLFLMSCTFPGVPGHVMQSMSDYDGTKQITMAPGWVCKGFRCPMQLGLSWNSKITDDTVILIAAVPGYRGFASGESLHFNIDGEFVDLESFDRFVTYNTDPGVNNDILYIPPQNWCSKRYVVTREFLKRLVHGKKVMVKLDLQGEHIEAVFSFDQVSHARPGFRKFLAKLEETK